MRHSAEPQGNREIRRRHSTETSKSRASGEDQSMITRMLTP